MTPEQTLAAAQDLNEQSKSLAAAQSHSLRSPTMKWLPGISHNGNVRVSTVDPAMPSPTFLASEAFESA
jgi:hypothetical protein